MGRSILLQDWITVAATEDGPITQDESEWLETGTFTDAIFYTSTAGVAGTPRLIFESSPSEDPDGFEVVEKISLSPSTNYTTAVIFDVVSQPISRLIRWRFAPEGMGDDAAFRIWITLTRTAR